MGDLGRKHRRATQADRLRRIEVAAGLLCQCAGLREYELVTRFLTQFPELSRRQGARYVSRARARLVSGSDDRLKDLAIALPSAIRQAMDAADDTRDLRAKVALLRLVSELSIASKPTPEYTGPHEIKFTVVRPDPSPDGVADPRGDGESEPGRE